MLLILHAVAFAVKMDHIAKISFSENLTAVLLAVFVHVAEVVRLSVQDGRVSVDANPNPTIGEMGQLNLGNRNHKHGGPPLMMGHQL